MYNYLIFLSGQNFITLSIILNIVEEKSERYRCRYFDRVRTHNPSKYVVIPLFGSNNNNMNLDIDGTGEAVNHVQMGLSFNGYLKNDSW